MFSSSHHTTNTNLDSRLPSVSFLAIVQTIKGTCLHPSGRFYIGRSVAFNESCFAYQSIFKASVTPPISSSQALHPNVPPYCLQPLPASQQVHILVLLLHKSLVPLALLSLAATMIHQMCKSLLAPSLCLSQLLHPISSMLPQLPHHQLLLKIYHVIFVPYFSTTSFFHFSSSYENTLKIRSYKAKSLHSGLLIGT